MSSTARTRYWDVVYDPQYQPFTKEFSIRELDNSKGPFECIVRPASSDEPTSPSLEDVTGEPEKYVDKTFSRCNLRGRFSNLTFDDCIFEDCDFSHSVWAKVKFSGCTFKKCSFTFTTFIDSIFLKPRMKRITYSAEYTRFVNTSIPASTVLGSIDINRRPKDFPEGVTLSKQLWRLKQTASKIARMILVSNRDQPDPDLHAESHKEFILAKLHWEAVSRRYDKPKGADRVLNPIATASAWAEYMFTVLTGILTDWGLSIARPALFFLGVLAVFATLYSCFPDLMSTTGIFPSQVCWLIPIERAIDVTLVVGYSKYGGESDAVLRGVTLINMLIGLYWYSLIIPAVIRRVSRS